MKKLLLTTVALVALALPAQATVLVEEHLSGTGDNVVFTGILGDLARATLNGQHNEIVRFRDLTGSSTFTAAGATSSNGNDIKISGTNNLFIQVFDPLELAVLGTTQEVFSLNGTGTVSLFVQASDRFGNPEAIQTFTGYSLDPNKPANFTLRAIDGEVMTSVRILETTIGGSITNFEHFRIDVAPAAVPGPIAGAGLPGLVAACGGLIAFARRRRQQA